MPIRHENDKAEWKGLLRQYVEAVKACFGHALDSVILYGSYARGDYREDSDIDIMILVDLPEDAIREKKKELSAITFDMNYDHDMMIMPIVKDTRHFHKWRKAYPFYHEIEKEGVRLYAA